MTILANTACNLHPGIEEVTYVQKKIKMHTNHLTAIEKKLKENQQIIIEKKQQEAFYNFIITQSEKINQLEKAILQSLAVQTKQDANTKLVLESLQTQYDIETSVFYQLVSPEVMPLTAAFSFLGYSWNHRDIFGTSIIQKSIPLLFAAKVVYDTLPGSSATAWRAAAISFGGFGIAKTDLFGMGFIINGISIAFGAKQLWSYVAAPVISLIAGKEISQMNDRWAQEIALYTKALLKLAKTEAGREIITKWLAELKQYLELAGKLEIERVQLEGLLQTGNQKHELYAKKLACDLESSKLKQANELAEHVKLINRYKPAKEIDDHNKLINDLAKQITKTQDELNAENNRSQDSNEEQQKELKTVKEKFAEETVRHQKAIDKFVSFADIYISKTEPEIKLEREVASSQLELEKLATELEVFAQANLELQNKQTQLVASIQAEMQQESCLKQNYELNHAHEEL